VPVVAGDESIDWQLASSCRCCLLAPRSQPLDPDALGHVDPDPVEHLSAAEVELAFGPALDAEHPPKVVVGRLAEAPQEDPPNRALFAVELPSDEIRHALLDGDGEVVPCPVRMPVNQPVGKQGSRARRLPTQRDVASRPRAGAPGDAGGLGRMVVARWHHDDAQGSFELAYRAGAAGQQDERVGGGYAVSRHGPHGPVPGCDPQEVARGGSLLRRSVLATDYRRSESFRLPIAIRPIMVTSSKP
jgi:hypothetical protein